MERFGADVGEAAQFGKCCGICQMPLSRLGTPQDTAQLVHFLCSPQGQWSNGRLLMSNGGYAS